MNSNFDKSFELTVGHEAGFTNYRGDRGNWTSGKIGVGVLKGTKYGVSAMSYPSLDIINLTVDDAKIIYKGDFWDRARCGQLPSGVDFLVFDSAINHGVSRAVEFLQLAVGAVPDGVIGPNTLAAVGKSDPSDIIPEFSARRAVFYAGLGTFHDFGLGWMRRLTATTIQATKMQTSVIALDQSKGQPDNDKPQLAAWGLFRRTT